MLRVISNFILKMIGWKITGAYDHGLKKTITIVLPHTSNWDFPLGMLTQWSTRQKIGFVIKQSWLGVPVIGFLLRKMGATAIDRSKNNNLVSSLVKSYSDADELNICFTPEGTRKKVTRLRTGFYHVARRANIPILMVKFDYKNKIIDWREPFYTTNDQERDFEVIEEFYKGVEGKFPENGYGFDG